MSCTSSCAFWACTIPNWRAPAKDSHPFAVQGCRTRQTVQRPGAAKPTQRLSGQGATGKSLSTTLQPAGNLPCRPLHNPARLAHETTPLPFPITSSRSTLSLGVGEISPENQKNRGTATKMFDGKFMQSSGYMLKL